MLTAQQQGFLDVCCKDKAQCEAGLRLAETPRRLLPSHCSKCQMQMHRGHSEKEEKSKQPVTFIICEESHNMFCFILEEIL